MEQLPYYQYIMRGNSIEEYVQTYILIVFAKRDEKTTPGDKSLPQSVPVMSA